MTADQEHLKCGTNAKDKNGCTIHFIRTIVLKEIILGELNKMISFVKEDEDKFVQAAMDNSVQKQTSELSKAKKALKQAEKRIAELDRLFTRLYEDNVSGKISDERFSMMSTGYEDEQKKLRATVTELTAYLDTAEQKSADVTAFIRAVQKYEHITELTPEIMHELIEKIVVHAPDKSSGHRTQEIEIHYRFDVAVTTAVADSMKYDKKKKGCVTGLVTQPHLQIIKTSLRVLAFRAQGMFCVGSSLEIYRNDRNNQCHNKENDCEPLGPSFQDRFFGVALVLAESGIIAAAGNRGSHVLILLLILHQAEEYDQYSCKQQDNAADDFNHAHGFRLSFLLYYFLCGGAPPTNDCF